MNQMELQQKATDMNAYLQKEVGSEPNDIIQRIEYLSIMISESGELLAKAKYNQDMTIHSETMKVIREGFIDKMSITTINNLIKALAKDDNYLVNQFDRINSAAAKQLAGLITILSYRKAEMQII